MPIKKRGFESNIRKRVYRCTTCDTHQVCFTNHIRDCWPICIGPCRGVVQADTYNSRREVA